MCRIPARTTTLASLSRPSRKDRPAFSGRAPLATLVLLCMVLSQASLWALDSTGSGTPGPLSLGNGARLVVDPDDAYHGFTLVATYNAYNIILIDNDGNSVHSWKTDRRTKGTAELLGDGTLLRGCEGPTSSSPDHLQMLDWNGTVLWEYELPEPYLWHHDVEPMPNGNVLVNAVVIYPKSFGLSMGRDPKYNPETLRVEPVMEIRPNGTTDGDIVWLWDPLDHLVQDHSPDKPNYGVVADHPELIDFNYPRVNMTEWQHTNAVAYNAELDQVMITNRNFDEIWVIDHGTTTEEAAGHSGGTRGKGGDILYRWGNPRAYGAGDKSEQLLFGPHDGHWIGPGLPGEGNMLVFNNGMNLYMSRPEGKYSTVEEWTPPVDDDGDYDLAAGSAFGPSRAQWTWSASPPTGFFAMAMGGATRLPDGDTLIAGGSSSTIFVVNPDKDVEWTHSASVFKAHRLFPPILNQSLGLEAVEDLELRVDLRSLVVDPDTGFESLAFEVSSGHASIVGEELRLLYPDGIPSDVFSLRVSDGLFEVSYDVPVRVVPVNDPVVLGPIPTLTAVERVPYSLELGTYISDPDTGIDRMLFAEDSPYATVERGLLRLLYPDGVTSDTFTLTVSDGEFESSTEVRVTVEPVNDPPAVGPIPDQEGVEDVPWVLDLRPLVTDVDSPVWKLLLATDSPYASLSGWDLLLLYPDGVTRDVVHLSVSDGDKVTVARFNVTVAPVNDPPAFADVPTVFAVEDVPLLLDLGPSIVDVDTPREGLALAVDSPFVAVDGLVLTLLYPDGVLHDEIPLEVSDGEFSASAVLVVDVEPVNDPPMWVDVPTIVAEEDVAGELDLSPYLEDVDTPRPVLEVVVDSSFGWMDGHVFRYMFPNGTQQENITFVLEDGEYRVELRTNVSVAPATVGPDTPVVPVAHAPMVLGVTASPARAAVGGQVLLSVIAFDADSRVGDLEAWVEIVLPDGTTLGNYSMAGVPATDGFTLVTVFDAEGGYTLVVRVRDADGQWASRAGTVLVVPQPAQGPEDGSGQSTWWAWATIALLAAVAASTVVGAVVRRRQGPRA